MRVKMKNLTFVVLLFTLAFAFAQANLSEENVNLNIFHSASESQSESVSEEPEDDTVLKQQNWSDESTACPQEMFLKDKKCRPCSQCGPDLYERSVCEDNQDTVCDWCLNPNPLKNDDFQLKCSDLIQLQKEFQRALEHTQKSHKLTVIKPVYNNQQQQPLRFTRLSLNNSYKIEMIMESCFYLALIALIFVVIRFISKSKPYYRTITVSPPMLDEHNTKDIIRAAEQIREKLGKKGYNRLEEFI